MSVGIVLFLTDFGIHILNVRKAGTLDLQAAQRAHQPKRARIAQPGVVEVGEQLWKASAHNWGLWAKTQWQSETIQGEGYKPTLVLLEWTHQGTARFYLLFEGGEGRNMGTGSAKNGSPHSDQEHL